MAVVTTITDNKGVFFKIMIFLMVAIVILFMSFLYNKSRLQKNNCSAMSQLYKKKARLSSLDSNDLGDTKLYDYYIKTSYNSCSAGFFDNDFVDVCALKDVIGQGARCLDFEIYSVDNEPVIATSSISNIYVKETYNSVKFSKILQVINDFAFSDGNCPNANDPLLLHFRMMSNNKDIYNKMAKMIKNTISSKLLSIKYNYEFGGQNLGAEPLKDFMGKIIIIVDSSNRTYLDTDLYEFVNLASNSPFMRVLRYTQDLKNSPDILELKQFNKTGMSIVLPDLGSGNSNYSFELAIVTGCQMPAMCFQNFDNEMENYSYFFANDESAFVEKPPALKETIAQLPSPISQNKNLGFQQRCQDIKLGSLGTKRICTGIPPGGSDGAVGGT